MFESLLEESWTVEDTSFLCPKKKMGSIGRRYAPSNYNNNMMMIKVIIVITVIIAIIANNETAMLSG